MSYKKSAKRRLHKEIARHLSEDEHYLNSNIDPAIKFEKYFGNMNLRDIQEVLDERNRLEQIQY